MKFGTTSVFGVAWKYVPRPASSNVSSERSIYDSINFSRFHRPYRRRMAADSGGNPRIVDTSLICWLCSRSISSGLKTLNSTSYGFRGVAMISLSLENPPSKSSPKSSPKLSSSLPWVPRKSSALEATLIKSSSDSMLVEAGVTRLSSFFRSETENPPEVPDSESVPSS